MQHRDEISVSGETVVAVHHEADSEQWFICCHGFRSDKSGSYEDRCERAVAEGYNAVRFDFRGCGDSSRSFDEQTLSTRIADLAAVIEYFEPASYVLFGSSFGGKVAMHYESGDSDRDGRCHAIAVRAPVTDNRALENYRTTGDGETDDGIPDVSPSFFDDLDQYPFEACALDVPIAIFHGRADESVPVGDSIDAAAQLDTDLLFQCYTNEGHLFSRGAESRMRDQLFCWLDDL